MTSSWLPLDDNDEMHDPIEELRNPRQAKNDFLKYLKEEVFKLNFYRSHMLYFIVVIAISSVIVYGQGLADGPEEVGGSHITYTDALFLCCSAMTTTGKRVLRSLEEIIG
jgi:hypothetical protein